MVLIERTRCNFKFIVKDSVKTITQLKRYEEPSSILFCELSDICAGFICENYSNICALFKTNDDTYNYFVAFQLGL